VADLSTVPELPVHEELAHQEALRLLNTNWEGRAPVVRHPAGISGAKRRAKDRLAAFVLSMFTEYLESEREYRANAVRVANAAATGHDRIAHEVRAVAEAIRTESRRLTDEAALHHRLLENRIAALEKKLGPTGP